MSWSAAVIRACLRVLATNRRLVVFPVVSGVAAVVVIAAVALGVRRLSHGAAGSNGLSPASAVLVLVGYGALCFIAVFCNAALAYAANEALRGGSPTIAAGFRAAAGRLGPIALWALISCTVSLVLRLARADRGGGLVQAVLGLAWQLTTYLVVPLLVIEGASVPRSMRRARELLRQTWGTNLGGTVRIALYATLAALAGAAVLIACGFALRSEPAVLALSGVAVLWVLFVALLGGTLSVVFRTALYRFATDGGAVPHFADLDLSTALH